MEILGLQIYVHNCLTIEMNVNESVPSLFWWQKFKLSLIEKLIELPDKIILPAQTLIYKQQNAISNKINMFECIGFHVNFRPGMLWWHQNDVFLISMLPPAPGEYDWKAWTDDLCYIMYLQFQCRLIVIIYCVVRRKRHYSCIYAFHVVCVYKLKVIGDQKTFPMVSGLINWYLLYIPYIMFKS